MLVLCSDLKLVSSPLFPSGDETKEIPFTSQELEKALQKVAPVTIQNGIGKFFSPEAIEEAKAILQKRKAQDITLKDVRILKPLGFDVKPAKIDREFWEAFLAEDELVLSLGIFQWIGKSLCKERKTIMIDGDVPHFLVPCVPLQEAILLQGRIIKVEEPFSPSIRTEGGIRTKEVPRWFSPNVRYWYFTSRKLIVAANFHSSVNPMTGEHILQRISPEERPPVFFTTLGVPEEKPCFVPEIKLPCVDGEVSFRSSRKRWPSSLPCKLVTFNSLFQGEPTKEILRRAQGICRNLEFTVACSFPWPADTLERIIHGREVHPLFSYEWRKKKRGEHLLIFGTSVMIKTEEGILFLPDQFPPELSYLTRWMTLHSKFYIPPFFEGTVITYKASNEYPLAEMRFDVPPDVSPRITYFDWFIGKRSRKILE